MVRQRMVRQRVVRPQVVRPQVVRQRPRPEFPAPSRPVAPPQVARVLWPGSQSWPRSRSRSRLRLWGRLFPQVPVPVSSRVPIRSSAAGVHLPRSASSWVPSEPRRAASPRRPAVSLRQPAGSPRRPAQASPPRPASALGPLSVSAFRAPVGGRVLARASPWHPSCLSAMASAGRADLPAGPGSVPGRPACRTGWRRSPRPCSMRSSPRCRALEATRRPAGSRCPVRAQSGRVESFTRPV